MDNARAAMAYFVSQGWSPAQAAAIVGNLMQESGQNLDTGAYNPRDPGGSIGIGQWNRERKAGLQAFAAAQGKPWTDFQTQLAYVQHELTGPESGVGRRLKAAGNVEDATATFIGYERPQGWTADNPRGGHGWSNRLANAQSLMGGTSIAQLPPRPTDTVAQPGGLLEAPAAPEAPVISDASPSQAETTIPGTGPASRWKALGQTAEDLAKLEEEQQQPFQWLQPGVVISGSPNWKGLLG